MAEKIKEKDKSIENKLKWDWWEIIPAIGLAKCLAINFDYAEKFNYIGFGGQFKKHIEQVRKHGLANSIPINIILYSLYQAPITGYIISKLV